MRREGQDADELELLYREHGAALLLFATSISGNHARAQDVVHQVFLKLLESGNVRQVFDKKAYLFACVRNAVVNHSKLQNRSARLADDVAWFSPPDRDYVGEQHLRRALSALPSDQREIMVLHVWCELTFAEIAELLDISVNTAASRYRYALAKLRSSMFSKEHSCANSR